MNIQLLYFQLLAGCLVAGTAAVFALLALRRAHRRIRELETHLLGTPSADRGDLYSVSSQVEALAAQVDRLSESHDFLSRQLAAATRLPETGLTSESRSVTPH